jgi:hypothetical protein
VSGELVVSTGGATIPASTGGAVGEHVGDMSVDRGAPLTTAGRESPAIIQDLQRAVGFAVGPTQAKRAQEVFIRHRQLDDHRERIAAEAAVRASWGAATEGNLIKIHGWILDTMGKELGDEFLGARDSAGTALCNKPALLEAMLKAAQATPAARPRRDNPPDPSVALSARRREIEGWMGARRGSTEYKKYYDDPKVQAEYQNLIDGVTNNTHSAAGSEVERRIAEIEGFMGARVGSADYKRYWNDPQMQEEYRQLQRRRQ